MPLSTALFDECKLIPVQLFDLFKVKVLKSIQTLDLEDMVLGQYIGDPNGTGDAKLGYLDDQTVPSGSVTPTFAVARFHINNSRWEGVPFILKCGKGGKVILTSV